MSVELEPIVKDIWRRLRRERRVERGPWQYVVRPERLHAGVRVTPLKTGEEAFPVMLQAIASAQSSVLVEMYIWQADVTGNRFREALIERARSGCAVRVLYDAIGSFSLPSAFVDSMRQAGIEVIEFHPVAPWRPRWGLNQRDHKKILVVDDRVAFTGGINFADENLSPENGGRGWFDWHVAVEGLVVRDLAQTFLHTWIKSGGMPFVTAYQRAEALEHTALGVQVISNVRLKDRWRMQRAYLWAIRNAERRIDVMNAYFIPERGLRNAFAEAVARGVAVRVIVPSVSDVPAVAHASRHLHKRLIQRGVRIFEWPKEHMMHAKIGVIDGMWSTVGSYNLDHRSLQHNLEVGLVVVDERLGRELGDQFERDLRLCTEVTLQELESRTWWQRFLGWFWYQMRAQL